MEKICCGGGRGEPPSLLVYYSAAVSILSCTSSSPSKSSQTDQLQRFSSPTGPVSCQDHCWESVSSCCWYGCCWCLDPDASSTGSQDLPLDFKSAFLKPLKKKKKKQLLKHWSGIIKTSEWFTSRLCLRIVLIAIEMFWNVILSFTFFSFICKCYFQHLLPFRKKNMEKHLENVNKGTQLYVRLNGNLLYY